LEEKVKELEGRVAALENILFKREAPEDTIEDVLVGLDSAVVAKLEVTKTDGEVRVHAREWLGKNSWRVVNTQLQNQGFRWESKGKDSYWWR